MPSWRCPHCETPQQEASRCWVCHRSSTSCGTCRHYRGSVAARVGFCGLDRRRAPLRGDEVRACWEDGAAAAPPDPAVSGLLDLLSIGRPGEAARPEELPPAVPRASRARSGSGRLWVEVEVEVEA